MVRFADPPSMNRERQVPLTLLSFGVVDPRIAMGRKQPYFHDTIVELA
jgi:hypothetical protein